MTFNENIYYKFYRDFTIGISFYDNYDNLAGGRSAAKQPGAHRLHLAGLSGRAVVAIGLLLQSLDRCGVSFAFDTGKQLLLLRDRNDWGILGEFEAPVG